MTSPEPITAPGVHDRPPEAAVPPFTPQQFFGIGQALLNGVGAFVLYALAGVQVFGVAPFGFLRGWADDLAQRADDAYSGAANAQTGANVANIEIAIIKAGLAADGIGGTALSDRFDGAAAGSLDPAHWSQTYTGPGIGNLGLDGSGNAMWFPDGGGPRASINFFLTPLDTDNEAVAVLLGSVPAATNATWPEIHLLLRMDGAGNAVAARLYSGSVQIGYLASNSFTALGSPVGVAMAGQQSYQFKARTVGATHTFSILQDNIEVASVTSPTSGPTLYGASYRTPGWIAYAGTFNNFFVFTQAAPPVVRVFSAGDIL